MESLGEKTLNEWVERRIDTSEVKSSELEDRSEEATQNSHQRDKGMKYMKKRRRHGGECKRVQWKSNRNFGRSNSWRYKGWKLFWTDSRNETSDSGNSDSVNPKEK